MMIYVLAVLLVWILLPAVRRRVTVWSGQSAAERSFAVRFAIFSVVLAFLFVGAFLFLPNRGRVIVAVPCFLAAMTLIRWWQNARARQRRDAESDDHFARARRIN